MHAPGYLIHLSNVGSLVGDGVNAPVHQCPELCRREVTLRRCYRLVKG